MRHFRPRTWPLTRRGVLLGLAGLFWPSGRGRAAPLADADEALILSAFVDVLLPADGHSPAGSRLGVHQALLEWSSGQAREREAVREACQWLQQQRPRWLDQTAEQREATVRRMATQPVSSLPGWFFVYARDRAMRAYYTDDRGRAALGLSRPPQPQGYLDLVLAPDE